MFYNANTCLTGDCNTNFLEESASKQCFVYSLKYFNLDSNVKVPTIATVCKRSYIDNDFTNRFHHSVKVLKTDHSDH